MTYGPAPLWSRGMLAVLAAQFLSTVADNALLFVALTLLQAAHYPDWAAPVLQQFFVGAFILLAPFVGPFADSMPKGRVMLLSNGLKLIGAVGLCVDANPFVAYGLVGVGAAAYSPAKFGILSELTSPEHLVKANSLMEISTVAALLVGAVTGGVLADWSPTGALLGVIACYAAAGLVNLLIPHLNAAHPLGAISLRRVFRDFGHAARELFQGQDTRFCIIGSSLFWGVGATMRFLLVAWVPIALGLSGIRMAAYLNAVVVVGIVAGAALAARFITLEKADRSLPAGVLIGIAVTVLSGTTSPLPAFTILTLIGICGGFFVVSLNALLQARGHETVGAGHAIAVQNLAENSAMLVMLGLYASAVRSGATVSAIAAGFGISISAAIAALWLHRSRVRVLRAQESKRNVPD